VSDERYPLADPDRSLGDIIGELTSEFSQLVTSHIDLAKAEIKQDVRDAGRAGAMFTGAGVAALVAVLMLSMAAAWGLAEVIEPGWAFLVVGVLWAIAAAVLGATGKKRMQHMQPGPTATVEELEEDKKWLKNQTN
jgi:uncharacterized membrane protein YqjE